MKIVNTTSEAKGEALVLGEAKYIVRASRKNVSPKKITEVLTNGIPASVERMIKAISKEYKDKEGMCDQFAKRLRTKLDKSGIEYEIYRVEVWEDYYISSKQHGLVASNRYHYGIKVEDLVYDNFSIKGISFQEWKNDLWLDDENIHSIRYFKTKEITNKPPEEKYW